MEIKSTHAERLGRPASGTLRTLDSASAEAQAIAAEVQAGMARKAELADVEAEDRARKRAAEWRLGKWSR